MPSVLLTFCFFHRLWECDKINRGLPSLQICDSQKPWNRRFNDEIQRNYSLDVRPWLYGRTALGCMHVRPKGIRTYDQRLLGRTSIDFLVGNHVTMWLKITKKRIKSALKCRISSSRLYRKAGDSWMTLCYLKQPFADDLQYCTILYDNSSYCKKKCVLTISDMSYKHVFCILSTPSV